jgi:Arc/MetJ family transcription regulator
MATNLAIDDKLLEEARIVGKHATKKAVVNEALTEYIQRRKQAEIIRLFHSVEYDQNYDYKRQRQKQ